ncbi:glycosyltransferase [Marivivens donghaensis]|uniref:Glycosyltransferase n=1 Tax=Marivivens donghaensis TaxID=1699413 RepID=A0ABX0W129_9RHOB|nr:glycosyltransferase [Marivivens donghaensis]NIY73773.1 glycosyltransferase [Marivivens donghaensis]
MRVGAVIVTFNRAAKLVETLTHVVSEPFDRIWVIDNASTDKTAEVLAAQTDPRLVVISLPDNTGGAGGFHAGIEAALKDNDTDWLALFDDDSWPEAGCVDKFREVASTLPADIGAVSTAVHYPNGKICEMNRQGYNPFWHLNVFIAALTKRSNGRGGFKIRNAELEPSALPREIDNASFVGFMLRTEAARRDGLPEAGLFIYGDDVLYSLHLRRRGWKILLHPALRFVHDCGTMGEGFVYRPLWKIYYHCRNGVAIARMAAGPIVFPIALAYYALLWWRRGRSCPEGIRPTYYHLMWEGLKDGLKGKRGRHDPAHQLAAEKGR